MFKKNEIKKALISICKNEEISTLLLESKTDEAQGNGAFLSGFAGKLYSDELLEYLNDNAVATLPTIDINSDINFGELSNCASAVHIEQMLNSEERNGRTERVCRVGVGCCRKMNVSGEEDNNLPMYRCTVENVTYLTENGNVLTVKETVYSKDGVAILTVRVPDSTAVPSVSDIIELFPEEKRAVLGKF